MKIGIIGYRNHASKHIDFLVNSKLVSKLLVFVYKVKIFNNLKNKNKINYTCTFKDLDDCDGILICSPTTTHKKYISYFIKKNKYIFCEKPGASSKLEVEFLKNLKKKQKRKIYFNYNLRFSELNKYLKKYFSLKKYGKVQFIDIKLTNGISFKNNFTNNWRFKSNNNFEKISANLGIHYMNLLMKFFKMFDYKQIINLNINKRNDCSIILTKSKNFALTCFFSYSSPYSDEISIYFTNSIVKFSNNKVFALYPRDTFDKKKLFKSPPKKKIASLLNKNDYHISNEKSLNYFLKTIKSKKSFLLKDFEDAIKSLKFFL